MSMWLNSSVCVDVGRSSVVGPKAPHEVSPTVQKGFGLGTTRGAMPLHHRTVKRLISGSYLMNGTLLRVAIALI